METLTTIKEKVEYLLRKYPETRDCDKLMVLTYYDTFHDLGDHAKGYESVKEWLFKKDVPTFSSVVRMRTWLQANKPSLRGPKYLKRAARAEQVVEQLTDCAMESGYGPEYS